mmetsp:Transcript_56171/g.109980  ORF Transcript_56171/g.109980 Transcript_56171/m.109980 type:complete len:116 (+) Transcript_56171:255-602(+)
MCVRKSPWYVLKNPLPSPSLVLFLSEIFFFFYIFTFCVFLVPPNFSAFIGKALVARVADRNPPPFGLDVDSLVILWEDEISNSKDPFLSKEFPMVRAVELKAAGRDEPAISLARD